MVIIAFFNNKGGVGKTTLVYHLAWILSDFGLRTIVADLDPQANQTASFFDEEWLEDAWSSDVAGKTISSCVRPLMEGTGDITPAIVEEVTPNLGVIPGNLDLSEFEDQLSSNWALCLDRDQRAFRVISAFSRVIRSAAESHRAQVVLVDVGPNLGAINRAALIASSHVVVPVAPDLYSLQGLRNLGPTLRRWREEWRDRIQRKPTALTIDLPSGAMQPVGYVVLQHAVRADRPVRAYEKWIARIPGQYSLSVMGSKFAPSPLLADDPNCLAQLKHYRSLVPMAQEAGKPIFHLRAADGAMGSHAVAAQQAGKDFRRLADAILRRVGMVPASA